jgi:hypothetical protein
VRSANAARYALIDSADGLFTINNLTGVVTVQYAGSVSFEDAPYYSITVVAWSAGGVSAPQTFKIYPKLYGGVNATDDAEGPKAGTVRQGSYSDCWLISALVELAYDYPQRVRDMISDVPGQPLEFNVQFPGWSEPVNVNFNNVNNDVWQSLSESNGFWVEVLEVAYVNGGGQLVASLLGTAIPLLTDCNYGWYDLDDVCPSHVFNLITAWRNDGYGIVTTDTDGDPADDLVPDHAYSVIYDYVNDDVEYVELRNPWGYNWFEGDGVGPGTFHLTLTEFMDDFEYVDFQLPCEPETDELDPPDILTDAAPYNGTEAHPLIASPVNTTETISIIANHSILSPHAPMPEIAAAVPTVPAIPGVGGFGIQNTNGMTANPPTGLQFDATAYGTSILPLSNKLLAPAPANDNAASTPETSIMPATAFSGPQDATTNRVDWTASAATAASDHDDHAAEFASTIASQDDAQTYLVWNGNVAGWDFPPVLITFSIDVEAPEGYA